MAKLQLQVHKKLSFPLSLPMQSTSFFACTGVQGICTNNFVLALKQLLSKENYSNLIFSISLSLVFHIFVFHCLLQILQDYCSYDLTRPMPGLTDDQHRTVIHEGPLRLLEKQGKVRLLHFDF